MGCGSSRSVLAANPQVPHTLPVGEAQQSNGQAQPSISTPAEGSAASTTSLNRKLSSKELGKPRKAPSRTPSGKEGRHGFVKESGDSHIRSSSGFQRGTFVTDGPVERASAGDTQGLLTALSSKLEDLRTRRSFSASGQAAPASTLYKGASTAELPLDVGFVFKKALEVKQGRIFTMDTLKEVIDQIVDDLDNAKSGKIPKAELVLLIQTTCKYANMRNPTEAEVEGAFPTLNLEQHNIISRDDLLVALQSMEWGLVPAIVRGSATSVSVQ